MAANPFTMGCQEQAAKTELFVQANQMVENMTFLQETISELITPEMIYEKMPEDKVFVLNIHPTNKTEEEYLINFMQTHKEKIVMWADSSDCWETGFLHYLQSESAGKIVADKTKSCLEILQANGFEVPNSWLEPEKGLMSCSITDALAARYLTALSSARIIDVNMGTVAEYYCTAFKECANEICYGRQSETLDSLIEEFLSAQRDVEEVKRMIDQESQKLTNGGENGRPIGFIELKDINQTMNLSDILAYGTEKFPWLFVILYSIGDNYQFMAHSHKLPITEVLEKYKDKDIGELLSILRKEVTNFQR
jgi:hypothetical protein